MPGTIDAVVDLSHWNTIPPMSVIKSDGVLGIFHKATNGIGEVDLNYVQRQAEALDAGLLWGAFHFGTGTADGAAQADYFLNAVKPNNKIAIALDWESNRGYGPSMTLAQAEAFALRVYQQTGRWVLLYTGNWWLSPILPQGYNGVLLNCPLWIASYGGSAPIMPPEWPDWLFWQHSNGTVGSEPRGYAHLVGCDMDRFNGSADDLIAWWGT